MKKYIITLSKTFPKGHARAGEPTHFREKFLFAQQCQFCELKDITKHYPECDDCLKNSTPIKIHTIRANYDFWANRIEQIQKGEACLVVKQWSGIPYRSKQETIAVLTKEHGIGVQSAFLTYNTMLGYEISINDREIFDYNSRVQVAENDGLSVSNFSDWFFQRGKQHSFSGAVIHFTAFRY